MHPSPVALFKINKDEITLEDCSDSFATSLNLSWHSLSHTSVKTVFGPEADALFRRGIESALNGHSLSLSIPVPPPPGAYGEQAFNRIFLFHAREHGPDGKRCLVALERRHRTPNKALQESGSGFGALNPHMFFTHDVLTSDNHYQNPAMADMLGLCVSGVDLRRFVYDLHKDDRRTFCAYVRSLHRLADGDVITLTVRMRDSNNKWHSLLVRTGIAKRGDNGNIRELTGVLEDFTDHDALNGTLEAVAQHVHDIEVRERWRIARELHDSTAQHLVAIDLGLSALRGPTLSGKDAIILDIRKALKAAQKEIRNFSYLLHPPQIAKNGLVPALTSFLDGFSHRSGLTINTTVCGDFEYLPPEVGQALFRVAQEAMMNTHRHARATHVQVMLKAENNTARLEIADNGRGAPAKTADGVGIASMKARIAQTGGTIKFISDSSGFRLQADCPYKASAESASGKTLMAPLEDASHNNLVFSANR